MLRTTTRWVATVAVVAAVIAPVPASAAFGDSSCSYNRSSRVLTVRAGNDLASISRGSDGSLRLNDELCTFTDADGRVFAATVRNTAQISFRSHPDAAGGVSGAVDLRGGLLAPGAGAEAGSSDEIEIVVGSDIAGLTVFGLIVADDIAVGTVGINLNAAEATGVDKDVVFADAQTPVRFILGPGADRIVGSGGRATGTAATRKLTVGGGTGADRIVGGSNGDTLSGDDGGDTVSGGAGNDTFLSEPGDDTLRGDTGDDTFFQGAAPDGADQVNGGGGALDIVRYQDSEPGAATLTPPGRSTPINVTLDGTANDGATSPAELDDIDDDIEHVRGGDAADVLTGSGGAETLDGGPGGDDITGLAGADMMLGGGGDDEIFAQDEVVDTIDGGSDGMPGFPQPGSDVCHVDSTPPDAVAGCETVNAA